MHTLTPLEESVVYANRAMEKAQKNWAKRYDANMDFWGDKFTV